MRKEKKEKSDLVKRGKGIQKMSVVYHLFTFMSTRLISHEKKGEDGNNGNAHFHPVVHGNYMVE
jgi:hypothetical protein